MLKYTGYNEKPTPEDLRRAEKNHMDDFASARNMHQHFWVAFMRFHVKPPFENSEDNPLVMDHENVMGGPLIACMACKKKYEAGLENTGCELDGS